MQLPEVLTIEQAATVAGVSRRTIERWIKNGRLRAIPGEEDRRTRLILRNDLSLLIQDRDRTPRPGNKPVQTAERSIEQVDWNLIVDEVLKITYSHFHRLHVRLMHDETDEGIVLSLDELRRGPLGRELAFITKLAAGETKDRPNRVAHMINDILSFFFWPPMADSFLVPGMFWETDFGRMLSLAQFRSFSQSELMTVGEAASRLGITRPTLYRWMNEGHLNFVRDELSGRTFVICQEVDQLMKNTDVNTVIDEGAGSE